MTEHLDSWPWTATNPAKPREPKRFEAVTYVEARAKAASWFKVAETVVCVRAMYEYEMKAARERVAS